VLVYPNRTRGANGWIIAPLGLSSDVIVGRTAELAALDRWLDEAFEGRSRFALIGGEAGVGKTRLTVAAEAAARERGVIVLHGECVEFGGDEFAYAPVLAALRELPEEWTQTALERLSAEARDELATLLPRLALDRPEGARFSGALGPARLHELVLDLLRRLSAEVAPVLFVLEDIHWADSSSRGLLAFFARNLRADRIVLVATYRSGEHPLRPMLAELVRRPIVAQIELTPLSRDDVGKQLEAIAGRPVSRALADRLYARAGGNPFFVEELFAAHADGDGVPASLADAVLLRVERLPADAERTLSVVAAAGGRIDHALLERLAPAPNALRAALDAGILVRDAGDRGVGFRHGLMGETLYARLMPGERTELHSRIASAMEAAPAAQFAYQAERAGMYGEALAASVTAGLEAERVYAFAEARVQFERALELRGRVANPPGDEVALLAHAAQAARWSGDTERAIVLCRQALAGLDHAAEPERAARLYGRLGEYMFWDDEAALECYGKALALLPPGPSRERASLLAAEGRALMGMRRLAEARDRCEAAGATARVTLGLVLAYLGEPEAGEARIREALADAEAAEDGEETARAYMHLGDVLRMRGQHARALDAMIAGEAAAARFGMRASFGNFMYVNGADDLVRLGRWQEAGQRLQEAERIDLGITGQALLRATAGHLLALRGETAAARAHLAHSADALPSEFVAPFHGAWAALALVERDPEAALGHVERAFAAVGEATDPLYTPQLHSLGARAHADLAQAEGVERLLAGLDGLLVRAVPPDALAHRRLVSAELARAAGRAEPERWGAAAEAWEALEEPWPAAYARFREGEATLLSRGDRDAAAAALTRAAATAAALGAAPLGADVEALARRARLDLGTPSAPATAREAGELTEREADVLRLLAEGMTNREIAGTLFISQKTVGAHLAHIFGKLGVHTRVEAAGRARLLGILDRPD
jgi:DNA-binding CsgD family transcriptional regulator